MNVGGGAEETASERRLCERVGVSAPTVNVLCLGAAILGVAALFCAWSYYQVPAYVLTTPLGDVIIPAHASVNLAFVGGWLFVLGTVLAFVTPLSGFAQAGGLAAFAVHFTDRASEVSSSSGGTVEIGLWSGFYVGLLSAALVLLSLVLPMGPGFGEGRVVLRNRLFVFRNPPRAAGTGSAKRLERPPLVNTCHMLVNRKWTSVLVAFLLVSVVLVIREDGFFGSDPLLTEVAGGVSMELFPEQLWGGNLWDCYHLSLTQGESGVGWDLPTSELESGSWTALDLGKKTLGDTNVSLTVLDILGNGFTDYGDSLVFTAQDGTEFADGVVYSMYWRTNQTIAWTGWEVSFVFGGGELDSWVSEIVRYGL